MAKITVHGGPSDMNAVQPEQPEREGSEGVSPGNSFEASPEKPAKLPEKNEHVDEKPAGTTQSHFVKGGKGHSTASSVDVPTTGSGKSKK
jgi:hypothetical protein